jgi:hypothetical protein
MSPASNSTNGTTPATPTRTAGSGANSSVRARQSFSAPETPMPCLFGESSSTTADNAASIAPSSETKRPAATSQVSLLDRLTPLLIARGLVRGITHSSIRKQSGAAIRASVLWPLDGGVADEPKAGCSSSNELNSRGGLMERRRDTSLGDSGSIPDPRSKTSKVSDTGH